MHPFQSSLWFCTVFSFLLLSVAKKFCFKSFRYRLCQRFSAPFYLWHVLLETGPKMPTAISKHTVCRIIVFTWLFLALHLTNCYKGIITTGTTAPPPKLAVLHSFEDLYCKMDDTCPKLFGTLNSYMYKHWQLDNRTSEPQEIEIFCDKWTPDITECQTQFQSDVLEMSARRDYVSSLSEFCNQALRKTVKALNDYG